MTTSTPLQLEFLRLRQHLVGLADAGRVAQKYFEFALVLPAGVRYQAA